VTAAIARTERRQQRHLDAIVINDRIRALALAGADLAHIRDTVCRGDAYVRRIAAWRLK
jgi:hypothetical protein